MIGVDAYPLGWVAVELDDGAFTRAMLAPTLYEVITKCSGVAGIAVDVPLGTAPDRWRAADSLVAEQLGPRRGSIFRVPPGPVWAENDFAAASKRCHELTGERLGRQAWAMRPKVLEANNLARRHPALLLEAHPELSFRTMNGIPLEHAKKTWAGQIQRHQLLTRNGILVPDDLGPVGQAPPDDILDAAAIAWTAHRKVTGAAHSNPSPPEDDGNGLPLAIWA
ncbi:DUF429 domain-containing protein [Actinoplanes sp. NBRC 103695]|uniref:DUF429 domain-containing protein n=1 Tax=Actinoplanes sp. NBRC 103695 TaxID=3032202 RepID=UPI0024A1F249|nr:DUF429 domain-containing protein [Actinoplanes sp. NBRC 103695]GLZ00781.1 hypothetical protein Acsp02_80330 [Actinoplanes sp. NBRC 103695]